MNFTDQSWREGLAGSEETRGRTLNRLLFPGSTREFEESRQTFGDTSVLPTLVHLHGLRSGEEHEEHAVDPEEGRRILFGQEAIGRARRPRLAVPGTRHVDGGTSW